MKFSPFRHESNGTNASLSSSDVRDDGHLDPEADAARDKPGLSRIFFDAFKFGQVLAEDNAADAVAPNSSAPQPSHELAADDDAVSIRRFAELVGRDLEGPELAASERLVKLSVNSWATGSGELGGTFTDEPEPIQDRDARDAAAASQLPDDTRQARTDAQHAPASTECEGSGTHFNVDTTKLPPVQSHSNLSPEEIVKLLVDEFGSLATSEDDQEKLLAEVDSAYFQEVAILVRLRFIHPHTVTHSLFPPMCKGCNALDNTPTIVPCVPLVDTAGPPS